MKKILCCLALLLTLTGCKDAVSGVTNGDEALITVGKTEITKNDVYTGLKTENGVTSIISKITAYVVEKEVPITDEIKKEANEYLAEVKKSISEVIVISMVDGYEKAAEIAKVLRDNDINTQVMFGENKIKKK